METQIKCPRCGSTQLTANKKGFSGRKAVAGAVLTGGIGLLAGTLGSNKIKITCLACGRQFNPGEGRMERDGKETQAPAEPKAGALIFALVFITGLVVFMAKACSSGGESSVTASAVSSEVAPAIADPVKSSNLKYDLLYPGEWTLSSQYPNEKDFNKLQDIYTNNDIFSLDDYIHAKKSKDFENDHKFIVCNTPDKGTTWNYYIVNVKTGKVKTISLDVDEITPPDISAISRY